MYCLLHQFLPAVIAGILLVICTLTVDVFRVLLNINTVT